MLLKNVCLPLKSIQVHHELDSDHRPVTAELGMPISIPPAKTTKTDWTKLHNSLKNDPLPNELTEIPTKMTTRQDVDLAINKFTNYLQTTLSNCSKQIDGTDDKKYRLPSDIQDLIREKHAATRAHDFFPSQENRVKLRSLQRQVKERVREYKSQEWDKLLSDLSPHHQAYWKLARSMKADTVIDIPALTRSDKTIAFEDADKAECLADSLEKQCSPSLEMTDQSHIDFVDNEVNNRASRPPTDKLDPVTVKEIENVQLLDKYNVRNPSKGTLHFATTHLIFVDHEMKKETWILLMHISSVERLPITTTGSPLLVRTKTFQSVFFVIPRERDCHEMHQTLLRLSQPVHIEELYCFHYKSTPDDLPKSAGWNYFDIQTEFQRMNVPNEHWVLCNANKDYELCDTYPSEIYVPARASTAVLLGSANFRSRGRVPALAYLHQNKAAITRCSQPLSGFSARCMEDEQMLDLIRRANPNCGYMYVVDTRPRINAMVNRAAGKGYENEAFYENIKFQFMGIGNIHVMRKSLQKLVETCEQNSPTMSSFLSGLESSGWLKHIKSILDTSWWIAMAVCRGVSVCVHCSDGWDRTAQACSLAALLLDPHYRTINGYQALIEKDWLSFGHKFSARCGHIAGDEKERAPVFTQLLDCTWQLLRQSPTAFQFNERFLLTLHDHAHAAQYGTFVGNCEKDRRDLRLPERSFSLWGYMANHLNEYKNPLYNPKAHPDVLKPDLSAQSIRFWRGMYCRHESGVHPRESLGDLLPAAVEHSSALGHHINYLTQRISTFKRLLSGKKAAPAVNFQNGILDTVEIETKTENLQIDNKLMYDSVGTLSELECANHDHPLKESVNLPAPIKPNRIPLITEKVDTCIPASFAQLEREVNTVALDWKSLKNVTECGCSTPLEHFSRKHHCWGCGRAVCTRCVSRRAPLPALASPRAAPLCSACTSPSPPDVVASTN